MDTLPYEQKVKRSLWNNSGEAVAAKDLNGNISFSALLQDDYNKWRNSDTLELSASPTIFDLNKPYMMPIIPFPNVEECSSKASTLLTGTAKKGGTGPSIGAVDIGVSNSAYFFRVALPGVKKDSGLFSCEIERDGKVHVRGVTTTGGETVTRHARVFEMKVKQQCPPGPFTLSFSLPGPVDPRLFFPNFRSDGILEAVIVKYV